MLEQIRVLAQKELDYLLDKIKQTEVYKSAMEMHKKSEEIENAFLEKFKVPCVFHYNVYKNIIYIKQDDHRAYTAQTYREHKIGKHTLLKVSIGLENLLPFTDGVEPSQIIKEWLKELLESKENVFTPYYADGKQEVGVDISDTVECDICSRWYLPEEESDTICYECRSKGQING